MNYYNIYNNKIINNNMNFYSLIIMNINHYYDIIFLFKKIICIIIKFNINKSLQKQLINVKLIIKY